MCNQETFDELVKAAHKLRDIYARQCLMDDSALAPKQLPSIHDVIMLDKTIADAAKCIREIKNA